MLNKGVSFHPSNFVDDNLHEDEYDTDGDIIEPEVLDDDYTLPDAQDDDEDDDYIDMPPNDVEAPDEPDAPLISVPADITKGPRTAVRTRRNLKIARMLMDGMSIEEVGSLMNLSRASIYRAIKTDVGVKYLVDAAARSMATMLPRVKRNYEDLLESEDETVKLNASRDVLKNVGIAPTSVPNTIITNITQNNTVVADSRAMAILREALRPKTLIDLTPKTK